MKRILLLFFVLLCSFTFVFAENNLHIDLDKNEIYIDESFVLNINLTIDQNTQNPLTVEWIDNFKQFGNQSSQQISIINGEQRATTTISLSFYPIHTGSFDIWPAQIQVWEEVVTSNILTLNILDINNIPQKWEEKNELNNKKKDNQDIEWQEINDVERNIFSFLDFNYLIFVLFIFLGFIFYFFKKYYGDREPTQTIQLPVVKISPEKQKSLLIKNLYKLQEQSDSLSKSEFYNTFNTLFKDYFEYLLGIDVWHLTYEEIKKQKLDKRLLNLFEKSYFSEFNNEDEVLKLRGKMIEDLLNKINK